MPILEVGRSQIRYDDFGKGHPLVFAHGVGGNRVSWFQQVPHYSRANRVICFDHRAFGASTDIEGHGRSAYVDDLLALVDSLGFDRVTLIGQSMGGGTCAAFACRHPDRVKGLVVADSLSGIVVDEPLATELETTREANRTLSQAERVLGPRIRSCDPESTLLYLQLASFNSVNVKTVRGAMPPWSPSGLVAAATPTLFVAGEHDVLFTASQIEAVASLVPNARFERIDDAGHSAYFENPRAFNAVLDGFLAELPT